MKLINFFVLLLTITCSSQTEIKSISKDIVKFYIEKNEIDNANGKIILENFKELVTIKELLSNTPFKCCKDGVYLIEMNASHTSINLLIINNNYYNIMSPDEDFNNVFNRMCLILKKNKSINKVLTIKYLERLVSISEENRILKRKNTLEPAK